MTEQAIALRRVPAATTEPPGIYIHIPFCRYVCPYCDFNVYARREQLIPDYVDALLDEMEIVARVVGRTGPAPTLFIGGGTPSRLPPAEVARIIEGARRHIGLDQDAEITMESNPDDLSVEYLRDIRSAGVNRLSIGVQSLQPAGLKVLGRLHGAEQARRAFEAARNAGFDNLSMDFIYGWPGQQVADWERDLETVLSWQPNHLSLYSLIVEPGTPYQRAVERGSLTPVDDDQVASYFDLAVERLSRAGWEHYEISNWAREPRYRSRHNEVYWQNAPYFGLGAGAHSYLNGVRASNLRLPERYIEAIQAGSLPVDESETITPELAMSETMILGLRLLIDGVSRADFERRHGINLDEVFATEIERFTTLGLLESAGDRVRLTPRGIMVSNSVLAEFLP